MVISDEFLIEKDPGGPQPAVLQSGLVAAIWWRQLADQLSRVMFHQCTVLRHVSVFV